MKNKPHKHAELIKAWADGAEIQEQLRAMPLNEYFWEDVSNPEWDEDMVYRIKPKEPKQKVKMWLWVYECGGQYSLDGDFYKSLADAIVALEDGYGFKVIQKADWTEIEVEVEQDES